jgi:hypothetical protein
VTEAAAKLFAKLSADNQIQFFVEKLFDRSKWRCYPYQPQAVLKLNLHTCRTSAAAAEGAERYLMALWFRQPSSVIAQGIDTGTTGGPRRT